MLSPEKALDFVRRNGYDHDDAQSQAKLQELIRCRLLGHGGAIGRSSGYDNGEQTEDALVALIECDDADVKDAVVAGCKKMYNEVFGWLVFGKDRPDEWDSIITRLCRVVDITSPPELHKCAAALLSATAFDDTILSNVRTAAMRGAMGYAGDMEMPIWERLTNDPLLCAYAFTAMLAIDPNSPAIDSALGRLLIRKVTDDWNVDTTLLAKRTVRKRKS